MLAVSLILKLSVFTNRWLSSLSYPFSPVTTDNGKISDVVVIIGLKSILLCLVGGARLILIVHMICCSTKIDNFSYFLLDPVRSVSYFSLLET